MIDLGTICAYTTTRASCTPACWHFDRWTVLDLAAMIRAGQGIAPAAADAEEKLHRPDDAADPDITVADSALKCKNPAAWPGSLCSVAADAQSAASAEA